MRVVLVSDTHSPRRWRGCPPALATLLTGADAILHAGDVCEASTLRELSDYAPVHAVLGNNDGADIAAWGASERVQLDLGGVAIGMVHDSGPAQGRAARLRRMFPAAALVVFGHSHIPWDETVDGQRAVNPGSPTDRRRQPQGTAGELVIDGGALVSVRIVAVT